MITPLGKLVHLHRWRRIVLSLNETIWQYPHKKVNHAQPYIWLLIFQRTWKSRQSIISFTYEVFYTQKCDFSKHAQIENQNFLSLSTKLFTQPHWNYNLKGCFINAIYVLLLAKAQNDFTATLLNIKKLSA